MCGYTCDSEAWRGAGGQAPLRSDRSVVAGEGVHLAFGIPRALARHGLFVFFAVVRIVRAAAHRIVAATGVRTAARRVATTAAGVDSFVPIDLFLLVLFDSRAVDGADLVVKEGSVDASLL